MNLDAIYEPTAQAYEHLSMLRFPLLEWRVFQAIAAESNALTARTLAQQLGLPPDAMSSILDRLASAGLIHVPEITYEELKNRNSQPPSRSTIPETRSAASASVVGERQTSVSFTLRKRTKVSASVDEPRAGLPLKLGALLHLVRERAGGGSLGQLAVYRMFLKVPEDLLQAAGFEHLDLDTADMDVTDPRLAASLREKACDILSLPEYELTKLLDA